MTLHGVLVCGSTLGLLGLLACDPKVADPKDAEAIEEDGDDDDDDGAEGNVPPEDTTVGTSVGSGPDCEGDDCDEPDNPPPPVAEAYAFAIRWGDVPEIDVGETDTGGSGGGDGGGPGPWGDPDSILVSIGNGTDSCADPWGDGGCGQWSVSFTLPADIVPGSYALADLNGSQSATGPDEGDGLCWGGGGSLDGTLVIESIDDDAIVGHIEDATAFDFDANVGFDAARCE